jgi:hypothetical protein
MTLPSTWIWWVTCRADVSAKDGRNQENDGTNADGPKLRDKAVPFSRPGFQLIASGDRLKIFAYIAPEPQ